MFLLGLAGVACGDTPLEDAGLPEWEGQRVVVKTELVDEMCVGTLGWMDVLVESIEAELDLDVSEQKIEVFVLEPEEIDARCGVVTGGCARAGRVYVSRTR